MTLYVSTCPRCSTVIKSERATPGNRRNGYHQHTSNRHSALSKKEQGDIADEMLRNERVSLDGPMCRICKIVPYRHHVLTVVDRDDEGQPVLGCCRYGCWLRVPRSFPRGVRVSSVKECTGTGFQPSYADPFGGSNGPESASPEGTEIPRRCACPSGVPQ